MLRSSRCKLVKLIDVMGIVGKIMISRLVLRRLQTAYASWHLSDESAEGIGRANVRVRVRQV